MEVFVSLIAEKIEPDDSVMERVTMRPIDTEDLCATSSFLEIGDVVFGKLLAQVETDRIELGYIAHVLIMSLCRYLLFNEPPWLLVFPAASAMIIWRPSILSRPLQSQEVGHNSRRPFPFRTKGSRPTNVFQSRFRGDAPVTFSGTRSARPSPRDLEWSHFPPSRQ